MLTRPSTHRIHDVLLSAVLIGTLVAPTSGLAHHGAQQSFSDVISKVVNMPHDRGLQRLAQKSGLNVVNVMWEDTGRHHGSSVGPNISDVTLQVREQVAGGVRTHLLPVIRHPNFSDKTADLRANKLWVRVGNEQGRELQAMPLSDVLGNLGRFLHDPESLLGHGDFTAKRDSHYLVSAQHVFVPLPHSGKAEFTPVIYNYQSAPSNPAVMTLLVTRQGMSATVIENRSGDQTLQGWGQQLFFNNDGQRTFFTAERLSAVKRRVQNGQTTHQDKGALDAGADVMMIVQIPLKHRQVRRNFLFDGVPLAESAAPAPAPSSGARRTRGRSDVEHAVVGHGRDLGPFSEMRGLKLERDERFPVRVTVQFYRATSNGVVSRSDLRDVKRQIAKVYRSGDFVGSLVVPRADQRRPTEWTRRGQWNRPVTPRPTPKTPWWSSPYVQ